MGDTESNENGSDSEFGQGGFSQEDIDALLSGGGEEATDSTPQAAEDSSTPSAADDFNQDEIDALMTGATDGAPTPAEQDSTAEAESVSQDDIDGLFDGQGSDPQTNEERLDSLGRPFDKAAAAMQAAIEEEKLAAAKTSAAQPAAVQASATQVAAPSGPPPNLQPVVLPDLSASGLSDEEAKKVSMLSDVDLRVKLELGRTRMLVEEVLKLASGSVVELDKLAGDPVDVVVNDRLVARGEVLVLNDNFCVRISEVLSHDPHRVTQ